MYRFVTGSIACIGTADDLDGLGEYSLSSGIQNYAVCTPNYGKMSRSVDERDLRKPASPGPEQAHVLYREGGDDSWRRGRIPLGIHIHKWH